MYQIPDTDGPTAYVVYCDAPLSNAAALFHYAVCVVEQSGGGHMFFFSFPRVAVQIDRVFANTARLACCVALGVFSGLVQPCRSVPTFTVHLEYCDSKRSPSSIFPSHFHCSLDG